MKIQNIILIFFPIFLISCNTRKPQSEKEGTAFRFITEYKHIYDADNVLQTTFVTEYMVAGIHRQWNSAFQTIYTYQENQLIRKEDLNIDDSGNLLFSSTTNYHPGREEEIHLNGTDTLRYYLSEYDTEGNLIHHIKYHRFSIAEFNMDIDDNFEEWLNYDSNGFITKKTFINYSQDTKKEIYHFYDENPTAPSDMNVEFLHYLYEQKGDSIITHVYVNGEPEHVLVEINKENSRREFTFDIEKNLLLSQETHINGDERIEVDYSPEFNSVDSTYYRNDKPVRQVSITPEMKSIETIRYDDSSNTLSMERNLTVY